jgi:hypothetical protein
MNTLARLKLAKAWASTSLANWNSRKTIGIAKQAIHEAECGFQFFSSPAARGAGCVVYIKPERAQNIIDSSLKDIKKARAAIRCHLKTLAQTRRSLRNAA